MIAVIVAAALAQASPEAAELGQRLASAGTLASIAPALMAKEAEDVLNEHPELTPAERDAFRAVARRVAADDVTKLTIALGKGYAEKLSFADLKLLVAAAETPAAARRRAAEPMVLASAIAGLGKLDFKGDALGAFCTETGKLCPSK